MIRHRFSSQPSPRGFTLIEAVVAIFIASLLSISTITVLTASARFQKLDEQRSAAVIAAEVELEQLRNHLYPELQPETRSILLDANRTPDDTSDDINALMEIRLYHRDGTLFANGENPSTTDRIMAEVCISWNPGGNFQSKTLTESLMTILTP